MPSKSSTTKPDPKKVYYGWTARRGKGVAEGEEWRIWEVGGLVRGNGGEKLLHVL